MGWKAILKQSVCSCTRWQHRCNQSLTYLQWLIRIELTIDMTACTQCECIHFLHIVHTGQVWQASCVRHLFPPIRFHFCCLAKLWHNRTEKWAHCCTTETFLFCKLVGACHPPAYFHVCWHTSLCWSVLVALWYTSAYWLRMCERERNFKRAETISQLIE